MLVPASSKRSKNSRSLGTKTCDRRGMRELLLTVDGRFRGRQPPSPAARRSLVGRRPARTPLAWPGPAMPVGAAFHGLFTTALPGRNATRAPVAEARVRDGARLRPG